MGKPRILIAGAGIGGIVAALSLLQRGFKVELYEQAADLREIGAGVQISPNGSRVLCALGLRSVMEAIASVPQAKDMRLFNTGQAWLVQDLGATAEQRFGSPYWLMHRGDLHAVLASACRPSSSSSTRNSWASIAKAPASISSLPTGTASRSTQGSRRPSRATR